MFSAYRDAFPDDARNLEMAWEGTLGGGWSDEADKLFDSYDTPLSTRESSGKVLNAIVGHVQGLVGGSADLAPSNNTRLIDRGDFSNNDRSGQNMHFGVREHAMGSIANGMALHGGIIPYAATFLIFSDYMRPSIRLAAIMGLRVVFVFTHDSVGVGEDGPTHQPIEQLAGLRAVPNLVVLRPADATETVEAWKAAIERVEGPTALAFSRQNLPLLDRSVLAPASGVRRGAYILWESSDSPDVILIATGSEVHIAMEAGHQITEQGITCRVVSLPSWELFEEQSQDYKESVLPPNITTRVSIEAASPMGWERYIGSTGRFIGLSRFGASAPAATLYEKFGLTAQHVVEEVNAILKQVKS